MKNIVLIILPVILFSCATNPENKMIPNGFQQITYQLDTFADNHLIKELKLIADVTLNSDGEINSAIQTSYSFENQDGIAENVENIYSPDIISFINGPEMPDIKIRFEQTLTDTLLIDGDNRFQYDEKSQLILISMSQGWFQMHLIYDQHGQWTQITKLSLEERSDHVSYEITEREIQYNDEPIESMNQTYLTVNGKDIFTKEKRSIVDYYVLLRKAAIFEPYNNGGSFDVSNGFFEYMDEGTGGGQSFSQIALFKTNDGKEILAINRYIGEAVNYWYLSGDRPKFYLFENNLFTELTTILPEVNTQIFFDRDYNGSVEGIETFYTLPQKGLSIQFMINQELGTFCKSLDNSHGQYEYYKDVCERYSNLKRTSIDIKFDKVSGIFKIKD